MYEHLLFLLYWFLNSLVLYLLGLLFPASVVLGTWRLTMVEAAIYAGFWLTFFVWTIGIWLVARYAAYTGLGIASFWWAFALGAVTNLLQAVAWKLLGDKLKG